MSVRGLVFDFLFFLVLSARLASAEPDFFILQSAGEGATATLEDVAFVSGDEKLKALIDELRSARYNQKFPDETPVKIVRRGTLSCKAGSDCTFLLALPDDVKSME